MIQLEQHATLAHNELLFSISLPSPSADTGWNLDLDLCQYMTGQVHRYHCLYLQQKTQNLTRILIFLKTSMIMLS